MVDFRKKVDKKALGVTTDPIEIYGKLDRASDKGDLRQVQKATLEEWKSEHRTAKDLIIKLHTGQGKTLIGLLILQAQINAGKGPALYLSPNNFLVEQTRIQAEQFGIRCVTSDGELPDDFINSKAIYIASVKKLFNGLTKFGLGRNSLHVGSLVVDDAHASIDEIRDAFTITLERDSQSFKKLFDLFKSELEQQGVGTFADLQRGERDALLPVPYWTWMERHSEVAAILSESARANEIKFAWPLVKDNLLAFTCVFSGKAAQIFCTAPPLSLFGSFENAIHRVYMSATTADDSFLVKGLGLSKQAIDTPLTYEKEKWSGERMILIPSLISEELDRSSLVARFGKTREKSDVGIVVLAPSFARTADWKAYGALVADANSIYEAVERLKDPKRGNRLQTVAFANRYEGIDLPDASCRILILDSKPWGQTLQETYIARCLENSRLSAMRTARTIEQGLGRAVRGEKDFCVVLIIGPDLVREIRKKDNLPFYSKQTQRQIEIGLEIAELAKEDLEKESAIKVLTSLVNQSLRRDEAWKAYYSDEMDKIETPILINKERLTIYEQERSAEREFQKGRYTNAAEIIQKLIDSTKLDDGERGWYLQEAARYCFLADKTRSAKLQTSAYLKNMNLLKPRTGIDVRRMTALPVRRVEAVLGWIAGFERYEDIAVAVDHTLADLTFGVAASTFEEALKEMGVMLGFASARPEREDKAGPDNLWCIRDGEYILFECKSEVDLQRAEIYKSEAGQINTSSAWFRDNYPNSKVARVLIVPPEKLAKGASFAFDTLLLRERGLRNLKKNVKAFFVEFADKDLRNLTEASINAGFEGHKLSAGELVTTYFSAAKSFR